MNIPETSMFNFFNKVLISLFELTEDGNKCPIETLIAHCKTIVSGGQRADYETILDFCQSSGLVQVRENLVFITFLGKKFLEANVYKYFEVTESQKQLIAERIVFKGAWSQFARDFFSTFTLNQISQTYEISTFENALSKEQNRLVHLLKYLGIVNENNFIIQVEKNYTEPVYHLISDSKTLDEQQLEKILLENRKIGAQAENVVVEFEKERLKKLGKLVQAELVKRISTINVAAGYDIESFNGDSDDIFPNRFIEVKATQGEEIRFYWSQNEVRVAKSKKDQYWIYVLKKFKNGNPLESNPIMIQNPITTIDNNNSLIMETHTFLIKEESETALIPQRLDEILWYQII